jgi:hypothetical protein
VERGPAGPAAHEGGPLRCGLQEGFGLSGRRTALMKHRRITQATVLTATDGVPKPRITAVGATELTVNELGVPVMAPTGEVGIYPAQPKG